MNPIINIYLSSGKRVTVYPSSQDEHDTIRTCLLNEYSGHLMLPVVSDPDRFLYQTVVNLEHVTHFEIYLKNDEVEEFKEARRKALKDVQ